MAQHRMTRDWYDSDGEVRYITHKGELCSAAALADNPVASPATSRIRDVEFGAAWDENDTECDDAHALDAIAAAMSGESWSADTLDAIARYVRETGRTINDSDIHESEASA